MISFAFFSMAAAAASTPHCSPDAAELTGEQTDYFLVEELVENCKAALAIVVERARAEAERERDFAIENSENIPLSTLDIDELLVFDDAQTLWEKSMEADCVMLMAPYRHVNPPVLAHVDVGVCEAKRIKQRIALLTARYSLTKDKK